jgi:tetratricopeptide (TPR) repeat protein
MKFSIKGKLSALGIILVIVALIPGTVKAQTMSEGMANEEMQKYETAKGIFSKILVKEPGNAAAMYHMGLIAFKNYQYDSARYFFNKGLQANASEGLNYIGLGVLDLNDKNKDAAKKNFDKALAVSGNTNAYVMQQIVDVMWLEQETTFAQYAVDLAQKALNMDPKNPRYAITLGDAYRLDFDGSKGITEYKKLVDANPGYLLAQLRIGEIYGKNNPGAAEDVYNKIIAKDPNYPPVYPDLGELYFKQNKLDKAKEAYKKFLSLVGNSCAERLRYAQFLYIMQDYKSTLDELNIVAKCLPENINVIRLKAYCEFYVDDFKGATADFQKLFSITKPEKLLGSDYANYGKTLNKAGQDSLALIYVNKAIQADSTNLDLYSVAAESYTKLNKFDRAAAIMELKITKSKSNVDPLDYYTVGRAYYYANNFVKADTSFAMVNKFFPTYAPGYLYRARSKAYQGTEAKIAEAKPYYEKYLELVKPDADKYKREIIDAETFLGKYYVSKKEYAAAKEHFLKVKELDPDNKENNDFLKFINAQKKK